MNKDQILTILEKIKILRDRAKKNSSKEHMLIEKKIINKIITLFEKIIKLLEISKKNK